MVITWSLSYKSFVVSNLNYLRSSSNIFGLQKLISCRCYYFPRDSMNVFPVVHEVICKQTSVVDDSATTTPSNFSTIIYINDCIAVIFVFSNINWWPFWNWLFNQVVHLIICFFKFHWNLLSRSWDVLVTNTSTHRQ